MNVSAIIVGVFYALALATATPHGSILKRVDYLVKNQPVSKRMDLKDTVRPRIINGQPAAPGDFPHQVSLTFGLDSGPLLCGGALITPNYVVSVAHCVIDTYSCDVLLGSVTLSGDENSLSIPAARGYYHSNYDPATVENDISMIMLSTEVQVNAFISLISFTRDVFGGGQELVVSGFGKTSDAGDASEQLIYAPVHSIENSECNTYYDIVPEGDICTSGDNGESTCSGDSGVPLIVRGENRVDDRLVGIASFGPNESCENGTPVAYTRISYQYDFILEVLSIIP